MRSEKVKESYDDSNQDGNETQQTNNEDPIQDILISERLIHYFRNLIFEYDFQSQAVKQLIGKDTIQIFRDSCKSNSA